MNEAILLIEDDENDVFFMKRAMQSAGVINPVHVASDGRKAIQYLDGAGDYADRTRFPLPALILLDLKLPVVMGLEVLKWIRARPQFMGVIVLVFTSSSMPLDISRAYLLGANSYLVKPSNHADLVKTVTLMSHYWLGLNQLPRPLVISPAAQSSRNEACEAA